MEDVEWAPWMVNRRRQKFEAMEDDHGFGPEARREMKIESAVLCVGTLIVMAVLIAGAGIADRDKIEIDRLTSVEATMQANGITQ